MVDWDLIEVKEELNSACPEFTWWHWAVSASIGVSSSNEMMKCAIQCVVVVLLFHVIIFAMGNE